MEEKQFQLLSEIPNLPNKIVPAGKSDEDNKEVDRWGEIIEPAVKKPHWESGRVSGRERV